MARTQKHTTPTPTAPAVEIVNPNKQASAHTLWNLLVLENALKPASKRVSWEIAKTNPRKLTKAQAVARIGELRQKITFAEAYAKIRKPAKPAPAKPASRFVIETREDFIAMAKQFGFALK